MRPANLVTSVADVLAGITLAGLGLAGGRPGNWLAGGGSGDWPAVVLLCVSTIGLYGGGVVFNDVFDAALDKAERPERPIPSGLVTTRQGVILGLLLLAVGILSAGWVNPLSLSLSIILAAAALIYDKWGKHHPFLGPLNMGICRGLNLLLGMSILQSLGEYSMLVAIVPVIYIATITMISRGEVHGGKKYLLYTAALLYLAVIACILGFSWANGMIALTAVFLLCFAWMIFRPLRRAIRDPAAGNIGKAVKAGVIGLILMDAAWAAASGSVYMALAIACLLPLSLWLARLFAVT
jgi:4-hydroxybenzoate polyprenyltransferase